MPVISLADSLRVHLSFFLVLLYSFLLVGNQMDLEQLELEQPLKPSCNLGTEVPNIEAKVQESWSTWWDRTSLDFWPCVFMRERNRVFFCWRTVIWDSNRKMILMDTGSRQKDLVPCSWLQKSTCYPYILSFTAQNHLTVPGHGRETQKERQPPGTSGHNGGLAALQASALVPGSHQHHLGNQGRHWMRPEDRRC